MDPGYTGQAKDEGETTTSTEKNERSMVAFWGHFADEAVIDSP